MRDRLIEILEQMSCYCYKDCDQEDCAECGRMEIYDSDIEKIADHLLANGVIVPLVNVGDTVYQVDSVRIYESKITAIYQDEIGKIIYDTDGIAFDERAIGKTVFTTREEAEQTLKERVKQ